MDAKCVDSIVPTGIEARVCPCGRFVKALQSDHPSVHLSVSL